MFTLVSCNGDNKNVEPQAAVEQQVSDTLHDNKKAAVYNDSVESMRNPAKKDKVISIKYHTPKTLKKYNDDVAAYHAAQQKIQADTIKSAQKIER